MQRPPDSRNSRRTQSGEGNSVRNPGKRYLAKQTRPKQGTSVPMPGLHRLQTPKPSSSGTEMYQPQPFASPKPTPNFSVYTASDSVIRLPTPRRQKFFILLAFIITLGLITYMPILMIRQALSPGGSGPSNSVSIVPPGVMGKPILPLTGQIMTGVSLSTQTIDDFEKDADKKVSLMLSYQAWGSTDGTQYFPTDWANSVRQHGSIPVIAWEPWVTEAYPQGVNEPDYALKNIIAGKFDAYIQQWAQSAKDWRGPFFLRFAPEMNANWTPWSENVNGNVAGEFVQTWKHVHDIFTTVGATNVTWVWNPNLLFKGKGALPLSEFYPGDAYVDWTALDGFNAGRVGDKGRWDTFSKLFSPSYDEILKFTTKPMMIAEMGCVEQGGNKATWITDAFSTQLPKKFPNIKALAWFNQTSQQDWRIETSSASQAAFSAAMQLSIYASNAFANYLGG